MKNQHGEKRERNMWWTRRNVQKRWAGWRGRLTLHRALMEKRGEFSTILSSVPGKVNAKASFFLLSCVSAKNSDYNENLKQCLIKSAWEDFFLDTTQACFLSYFNLLYWACVLNQCSLYSKSEHRKEDMALTLSVIWLASSHWCSLFQKSIDGSKKLQTV